MEIKILGEKYRLEILALCVVIGAFIAINVFCSCAGGVKEGFQAGTALAGAALDYTMGKGVSQSWEGESGRSITSDPKSWFGHLDGNQGGPVPLAKGQLFMFGDNKFDGSCCPSTYTNSSGCACLSPEQAKYLNERGGNRTLTTEY
jgi:hypothetical protein